MKKILVLLLSIFLPYVFIYAQENFESENFEYESSTQCYWGKETFRIRDLSTSNKIEPKDLSVDLIVNEMLLTLVVGNRSNHVIQINWGKTYCKVNNESMVLQPMTKISYSTKEQIEKVRINGSASQTLVSRKLQGIYGELMDKIINTSKFKTEFKKQKSPVSINLEISIPIIIDDIEFDLIIYKKGFYNGKKKK